MIFQILFLIAAITGVVAAFLLLYTKQKEKSLFYKVFNCTKWYIKYPSCVLDIPDYFILFNNKNSKLILTINYSKDNKVITVYNSSLVENSVKKYFENELQFDNFIKSSILSKLDLPTNMSQIKVNLRKDINKFKIVKI